MGGLAALTVLHGFLSRQVPLLASTAQALAQTAAVFVLAYLVAPTIVTMQQQQLQLSGDSRHEVSGTCAVVTPAPVPLQCGLRPEHSALLPCRPLALQVLLGLAMVAWPVWLSWAVERRLRRQHAELCADWGRRQAWVRGGQRLGRQGVQQQAREDQHPASADLPARESTTDAAAPVPLLITRQCDSHGKQVQGAQQQSSESNAAAAAAAAPAAAPGVRPAGPRPEVAGGATAASAPGARYRSCRRIALVSVKVRRAALFVP